MTNFSPFFILGNPRSGTSLFRLMLNSNPQVVVPPECGFAEWLYTEFGHIEVTNDVSLNFLRRVFDSRKFETWHLDFSDLYSKFCERKPKNYQELVREVYAGYARKLEKENAIFGDKNNYYMSRIDKLEEIFPGCKKIFIVRDGRDVACSYLALKDKASSSSYRPNLSADMAEIANEWCASVDAMEKWTKRGAFQIKYEDLVAKPSKVLSEVCDFLSVPYSADMLSYYENNDEPEDFKAWKSKTFEPVSISSIGNYKKGLTQEQLSLFENIAGERLQAIGYTLIIE